MADKPRHPRKRAFTLVELLVVIGLIAVLIALLLPVLSGARKQANQIACLSNLRQVGGALLAYANEHRGWFPAPANVRTQYREDWVHWQPGRNFRESAVAPYLGNDDRVLKCPLGPWEAPTTPAYPYSYTVNNHITGSPIGTYGFGWTFPPYKLTQIVEAPRKVLAIEEDVTTLNDGEWWALEADIPLLRASSVSVIHDRGQEFGREGNIDPDYEFHGSGNVVFADGHCDVMHRKTLRLPSWTDPVRRGPYEWQ